MTLLAISILIVCNSTASRIFDDKCYNGSVSCAFATINWYVTIDAWPKRNDSPALYTVAWTRTCYLMNEIVPTTFIVIISGSHRVHCVRLRIGYNTLPNIFSVHLLLRQCIIIIVIFPFEHSLREYQNAIFKYWKWMGRWMETWNGQWWWRGVEMWLRLNDWDWCIAMEIDSGVNRLERGTAMWTLRHVMTR